MADDHVRLEFVAAVEMDATRVMRFIQELKDAPQDAWCEVQNVWSKSELEKRSASVLSTVQIKCERRIADILCRRFSSQSRHVSCGEVLTVRCRRVYIRSVTSASSSASHSQRSAKLALPAVEVSARRPDKSDDKRPVALPRSMVIDLLDLLGDDIVDVLEVFQRNAVMVNDTTIQLTMIGLVQALQQLASREQTNMKSTNTKLLVSSPPLNPQPHTQGTPSRLQIQHIRHLLTRMSAHAAVSLTTLPDKNDMPFLSYTDFIAVYVAYMSTSSGTSDTVQSANTAPSASVKSNAK